MPHRAEAAGATAGCSTVRVATDANRGVQRSVEAGRDCAVMPPARGGQRITGGRGGWGGDGVGLDEVGEVESGLPRSRFWPVVKLR